MSFSMLGMQDYGATIRPWADRNLRHAIRFVASSSVVVADEDLPLFMLRW